MSRISPPKMFVMNQTTKDRIRAMFWDMPPDVGKKAAEKMISDPLKAFSDEHILLKALNSLSWYELVQLAGGPNNLVRLLDDRVIGRLFPESRRNYYRDAKRLLSKYIISTAG